MSADTIVTGSKLTAVADAIRERGGTDAPLTLDAMPAAVAAIPSGSDVDLSEIQVVNQNGSELKYIGTGTKFELHSFAGLHFTSLKSFFSSKSSLQEIDMSGVDLSGVTNISYFMYSCNNLTSLNMHNVIWPSGSPDSNIDLRMFVGSSTNRLSSMCLDTIVTSNTWMNYFNYPGHQVHIIWNQGNVVQPLTTAASTAKLTNCFIYVPDNMVQEYQSATNWCDMANNIKGISTLPDVYKQLYGYGD